MRKRKSNTENLPKCMYKSHGKYYYVRNNRWVNLGSDKEKALSEYEQFFKHDENDCLLEDTDKINKYLKGTFSRSRQNAKGNKNRREKPFELELDYILEIAEKQKYKCAVTGTRFSLRKDSQSNQKPFAPSIDRIDNSIGYEIGNVRLVCVATNYALNAWGDDVFGMIARNFVKKHGMTNKSMTVFGTA